jgi:hypothetical protein
VSGVVGVSALVMAEKTKNMRSLSRVAWYQFEATTSLA